LIPLRIPGSGTLFSDEWRDLVLAVFFAAAIFRVMVDRQVVRHKSDTEGWRCPQVSEGSREKSWLPQARISLCCT
jgi:hypothetical protein